MFLYKRKIQFYETDLMGIVHHSNYIRFFEEARVAWAFYTGLLHPDDRDGAHSLTVVETQVQHKKPSYFGQDAEIDVQAKMEGVRLVLEYRMKINHEVVALGRTTHVKMSRDMKPLRPDAKMLAVMEKEKWNETWL